MAMTGNVRKRSPSPTLNSTININLTNSETNSPLRPSKSSRSSVSPTPGNSPAGDGPFPGNVLEKNKIVDGVFSEEAEKDMDGDESFSFSLLNGKPQIKICSKVLEEVRHQWKNSLIVTLLGKAIKYDALCNKACALWNLRGDFKALDLGENYILFTFKSMEDRMRVYTEGPWVVMDHFLSICKWEPNFKPSEGRRILRTAVWVRFLELPVEFLHDKIIYHIAKSLGRPIKVDHSAQGKFARVCIEINLSKPLCPVIEVEGKECTVEYESLHSFCFDGSCFGQLKFHNHNGATILEEAEHKTNQLEVGSKTIREDELDTVKPKESPETLAQNPFMGKTPSPFTSFNPQRQQPRKPTFWTQCPHCRMKYEYYRDVVNKSFSCQQCKKIFIGHEIKNQPMHPIPFSFKPNNGVKVGSQGNTSFVPQTKEPVAKAGTSEVRRDTKAEPKVTAKVNGKRKKRIAESESSDSDSSSESEEENIIEENGDVKVAKDFGCFHENLRRSSLSKTSATILEEAEHKTNQLEVGSKTIREDGLDRVKPKESPETYGIPEPEFFNFDVEKSPEKFQPGQFWALYSDEDRLRKCYAFINKVDHEPEFKLHVTWLIVCPTKNPLMYADKDMPVGCGMFKHDKVDIWSYTNTSAFSHRLIVEPTSKMDEFAIYPRKGDVWAVYKNWKSGMTPSDLKDCEYDILEILWVSDVFIKGLVLEMVSGHNSVFKAKGTNVLRFTIQIDRIDLLKFSHQIPAFRLTGEKGGSLRGFWELDPAALPSQMFCSS